MAIFSPKRMYRFNVTSPMMVGMSVKGALHSARPPQVFSNLRIDIRSSLQGNSPPDLAIDAQVDVDDQQFLVPGSFPAVVPQRFGGRVLHPRQPAHHLTTRVHHQTISVADTLCVVPAALRGGQDPTLRLNGPGAEQDLPVRSTGRHGEGTRVEEQVGAQAT